MAGVCPPKVSIVYGLWTVAVHF